jgi:hypothetical protein
VGSSVKVEVRRARYTVHPMAQRTVDSPVNIRVKEAEVSLNFGSMVNGMTWRILFRWFRESFSLSGPCGQMTNVSST